MPSKDIENLAVKRLIFSYDENQKGDDPLIKGPPNVLEFDLIGPDASLANAFRRILLAEVCS